MKGKEIRSRICPSKSGGSIVVHDWYDCLTDDLSTGKLSVSSSSLGGVHLGLEGKELVRGEHRHERRRNTLRRGLFLGR